MLAVEYDNYGPPEVLQVCDVPMPGAGRGMILVKIVAASVNPKDSFVRKGRFRLITGRRFPRRTGYDFSGVAKETGPGVRGVRPGDRVFGMVNGWTGGACAEYLTVKQDEVAVFSNEVDLIKAAAVPLAAQTALQALRDIGKIKPGDRVCINGASGGVGSFAIQIAVALGGEVTAVSSTAHGKLCRELGANRTIDYSNSRIEDSEERFDIFFDVFGNKPFDRVKHLLGPEGAHISTVPSMKNFRHHLLTKLCRKRARMVFVKSRRGDLETLLELMRKKALRPVIDAVYPLEKVREAHRHVETKHTRGKVLVKIGGESDA
jgi:NADPH:quinone reductase-like Zn-dependent oxidoreductase